MEGRRLRLGVGACLVGTLMLGVPATAHGANQDYARQLTRDVLAEQSPPAAPGAVLTVARVTIPPGGTVSAHQHPTGQVATIVSGRLRYTVLTGTAFVTRAGHTSKDAEAVEAGHQVTLRPGDTVLENPGMVHRARNRTARSVVVLTSIVATPGETTTINVPGA